jgi:hypothetical protein
MAADISIVPSYDIDKNKWDSCVARSNSRLIYGSTTVLDHLADNWSGIVMNDYEAVMPVPWRRKWGVTYHYHVPFVQQLGIFFHNELTEITPFTEALFTICRYGNYPFNYGNGMPGTRHTNYILPMEDGYRNGFSADVVQNIRRAEQFDHTYTNGDVNEAIDVFYKSYGKRSGITENDIERFRKMCFFIGKTGKIVVRKVMNNKRNLLAIALLLIDGNRMYNIMNTTVDEGRQLEANYFLLSEIWGEFTGKGLIFDFEGSDIPGVKTFYKKFGASDQPYVRMHFNHLPWPMKKLMK